MQLHWLLPIVLPLLWRESCSHPSPSEASRGPSWLSGAPSYQRGEVGLIFARVGLAQGALTADLFAALALAITGTTLAGPVLLRKLWPRDDPTPR